VQNNLFLVRKVLCFLTHAKLQVRFLAMHSLLQRNQELLAELILSSMIPAFNAQIHSEKLPRTAHLLRPP
jgi:hypothetical protein